MDGDASALAARDRRAAGLTLRYDCQRTTDQDYGPRITDSSTWTFPPARSSPNSTATSSASTAAKKAVAVAIRNRWRRQQLPPDLRKDVTPKNIILIGPTGVGKTEIARRLAQLVGAPFLKVEATKFTEVGYVGRDVESMVRDLAEAAVGLVKQRAARPGRRRRPRSESTERLLDLLVPGPEDRPVGAGRRSGEDAERRQRTREKMRAKLDAGELEDRIVELTVEQKAVPVQIFSNMGMENMDVDLQSMFEQIMPQGRTSPAR